MKKEFKIGLMGIVSLVMLFCGMNYLKGINMFNPESYYLLVAEGLSIRPFSFSSSVSALFIPQESRERTREGVRARRGSWI